MWMDGPSLGFFAVLNSEYIVHIYLYSYIYYVNNIFSFPFPDTSHFFFSNKYITSLKTYHESAIKS